MLRLKPCFALALVVACGLSSSSVKAGIIPSPANDLLLSSSGGVADINGSTVDGGGQNYAGLPPANLNDGNRDGIYNNGEGVDGVGSIAHSAGVAANQEMGVKIPAPTLIGTVDLFNRTDCCNSRIDAGGTVPFTLNIFSGGTLVYTNDYTFTPTIALSDSSNHTASGMVMTLPTPVVGDYVQIVQHPADYMNLAELEAYSPVPEPTSCLLFGLGAIGLFAVARRSRA